MRKGCRFLRLTVNEFRKWAGNKRILAVSLMLFTAAHFFVSPMRDFCRTTGYRTTPYIFPHLVTDSYVVAVLLFITAILFCNAPFMDNLSTYEIARSGKARWFIGKLLYVYAASFVYVSVLFLLTLLLVARYLVWIGEWGKVITTLSLTTAGESYNLIYFSDHILTHYRPVQATLLTFLMLWLQTALVGIMIFAANLLAKRSRFLGVLLAAVYGFAPFVFRFWGEPEIITFFPAMWSIPYFLKPYIPGVLVTYTSAFWLLALLIAVLSYMSWFFFRKRNLDIYPEL